jgi:hypothetical protein
MTDHPQKKAPRRGTYTAKLEKVLETLFPKSLDDIVRKNREHVQIGLATAEELASRAARIEPGRPVDTIDQWRLIAFRALGPPCTERGSNDNFRLSLLGDAVETRRIRITSEVAQIDVEGGFALTQNSLYKLGVKGKGEPPREHLVCIAAATHSWGWGASIGAPQFFY